MSDRLQAIKNSLFGGSEPFGKLHALVRENTYCNLETLKSLANLASRLDQGPVEGDIVECGTYKGGSAAVISQHSKRHLWLYDSFEGLPAPSELDGSEAVEWTGKCYGRETDVIDVMNRVGTPPSQYTIVKGWFSDTFKRPLPKKIALLHCDADWYDSVFLCLETFYPLMDDGAVVVLDDFGAWEGCREAYYDFCCKHNVKPLLERVDSCQAFWEKGKGSNRPPKVAMKTFAASQETFQPKHRTNPLS